jgi:hypothetical protein
VAAGRRTPLSPHHANKGFTPVEVEIDLFLRPPKALECVFPSNQLNLNAKPVRPALIECIDGCLRCLTLILQVSRRSEKDLHNFAVVRHSMIFL